MGGKVEKITSLENCLDVAEALEEMTEEEVYKRLKLEEFWDLLGCVGLAMGSPKRQCGEALLPKR